MSAWSNLLDRIMGPSIKVAYVRGIADTMCACDVAVESDLRSRQVDAHPEPGGRHVFRGVDRVCGCGLVVGGWEYRRALSIFPYVLLHRRYADDRIEP